MGLGELIDTKPFTNDDVQNKELVIKMLNYEEAITRGDIGKSLYSNTSNLPLVSLNVEHTLNRLTLTHFGFDTSDVSVATYRTIFKTYYQSPSEYDKDVLNAVHYMRENKCVYYTAPILEIGEMIPNCDLYHVDGITKTTLYDAVKKSDTDYTVIAAFSLS